jgi:Zn-dependent protease with chaperone function
MDRTFCPRIACARVQCRRKEFLVCVIEGSDADVEAFSVPPGVIVLSEGLLRLCMTDDMLAFVLGHELCHLISRHHAENMSRCDRGYMYTNLL